MSFKPILVGLLFCFWKGDCCYQSGWSRWINDYKPSTKLFPKEKQEGIQNGGGDVENMNQTERATFCPPGHGTISDIECNTFDDRSYNTTATNHNMECSVDNGFKCSNRLVTGQCSDYKIRLFCRCNNPLLTPTISILPPAPKDSTGQSGLHVTSPQNPSDKPTRSGQVIGTGKVKSDVTPRSSTVSKVIGGTIMAGQVKGNAFGNTDSGLVPTTHASGQRTRDQGKAARHNGSPRITSMSTTVVGLAFLITAVFKFISE